MAATSSPTGRHTVRTDKFHTIKVRVLRRDAEARARAGYVSPPSAEMRRAMRASVVSEPMRMLKRSSFIDVWSGVTRAVDASGRVVVTWEPGRGSAGSNAKSPAFSVTLKATTKEGKVLYDGTLAADAQRRSRAADVPADRAEFDAPVGRVQLDMTIFGERGEKLDIDARDLEVPNLKDRRRWCCCRRSCWPRARRASFGTSPPTSTPPPLRCASSAGRSGS